MVGAIVVTMGSVQVLYRLRRSWVRVVRLRFKDLGSGGEGMEYVVHQANVWPGGEIWWGEDRCGEVVELSA